MKFSKITTLAATITCTAALTQSASANIVADLAADYTDAGAVPDTTAAQITTPNGTWEYLADNDIDPTSGATHLLFRSAIGVPTPTPGFGGTDTIFDVIHNMPAVSNGSLFDGVQPQPGELALHPGDNVDPDQGILVVKFTPSSSYTDLQLDYSFRNTTGGDGVALAIFDDALNELLAPTGVNTTTVTGSVPIPSINAGESIYLLVTDGPGSPGGDQLFTKLTLTQIPEPASLSLLALGTLALVKRKK